MAGKPEFHGRDHRPGGADPFTSFGIDEGDALTADGVGGIRWTPVAADADASQNPRFVAAYTEMSIPDAAETQIEFDNIRTNDDPEAANYAAGVTGYQLAEGRMIDAGSLTTWEGSHFTHGTSIAAFTLNRAAGVYLMHAGIDMLVAAPATITIKIDVPQGLGGAGEGAAPFSAPGNFFDITEIAVSAQYNKTWSFWVLQRDPTVLFPGPESVSMYVTQDTGSTISAGPPRFSLSMVRLSLPTA